MVNRSINQTLSRTVLTSGLTFLTVLSLFLFGGEVLHGFSFALVVGILIGTYSSIAVAAPMLVAWQEWRAGREAGGAAGGEARAGLNRLQCVSAIAIGVVSRYPARLRRDSAVMCRGVDCNLPRLREVPDHDKSFRPALFSVQAKLFGNLREQTWHCQVSIAKKSQAQSPLPSVTRDCSPGGSGRASLAGVEILVSSTWFFEVRHVRRSLMESGHRIKTKSKYWSIVALIVNCDSGGTYPWPLMHLESLPKR